MTQEPQLSLDDYARLCDMLAAGYDELVRRTLPAFIAHHMKPTSLTLSSPVFPGYFADWDREDEWGKRGTALWLAARQGHHHVWCERTAEDLAHTFGAMAFSALRVWKLREACSREDARAALTPLLCDGLRIVLITNYLSVLFDAHFERPIDPLSGCPLTPRPLTCAEKASVGAAGEKCESAAAAAAVVGEAPQRAGTAAACAVQGSVDLCASSK